VKRALLAVGLGLASAVAVYVGLSRRSEPPEEAPAPPAGFVSADEPADGVARRAAAKQAGELPVASGETIELEAASLVPGRPVALRVFLGEPSKNGEPLPVRIYAADGRASATQGLLGDDRLDARVEIDPASLAPGRNIVEVQVTEFSHFPMRRYAIEVR
jgi:ADP-ribose pyrophosphatase YjhB (NUDIX family)